MAECTSCGGFVTDDYVRVFGDNEGNISDCRSCRARSGSSGDDTEDEGEGERVVLLRDVAEEDTSGSERETAESTSPSTETVDTDESVSSVASPETAEGETDDGASGGARERIAGLFSSIRG